MTALSINVNKFALIRNARGADMPNLVDISKKCIEYGADGITVHPRPDERHVKFSDLQELKNLTNNYEQIEFNIEGYPSDDFIKRVIDVSPDQVTLVPDPPEALTSSFGWDCEKNKNFLNEVINKFRDKNIRVSIFINPSSKTLSNLETIRPDRVELYTYDYAKNYKQNKNSAIKNYLEVTDYLKREFPQISLNAGHDLNLDNLDYILENIPSIKEVSIGHALVCDSIDFGLKETIKKYKKIIQQKHD
jgi:pyridoxine 5-phosphate synthase